MLRRTKSSTLPRITKFTSFFSITAGPSSPPASGDSEDRLAASEGLDVAFEAHQANCDIARLSSSLSSNYDQLNALIGSDGSRSVAVYSKDETSDARLRRKFARQGMRLLAQALTEDSSAASVEDIQFSRNLYLNALEYILQGLPDDLTVSERRIILSHLRSLLPSNFKQFPADKATPPHTFPLLTHFTFQFILVIKRLTPHIRSLTLRLIALEEQHRVLQTFLARGLAVAERSVDLAGRLGVGAVVVGMGGAIGKGLREGVRVWYEDDGVQINGKGAADASDKWLKSDR